MNVLEKKTAPRVTGVFKSLLSFLTPNQARFGHVSGLITNLACSWQADEAARFLPGPLCAAAPDSAAHVCMHTWECVHYKYHRQQPPALRHLRHPASLHEILPASERGRYC